MSAIRDFWIESRGGVKLPAGTRWLEADDIWQDGDAYYGNGASGEIWVIGDRSKTSIKPGTQVGDGWLCYLPHGSIRRRHKA